MTVATIRELFANDISRRIEEVIKVDQADEQIIRDELAEYVVTDSIRGHLTEVLESYWETPKKPHEGVAIWVSGFFGSGKSSFAKYLGLGLQNRTIGGVGAAKLLAKRIGDAKAEVLLSNIAEQIPTEAVIFDVSTRPSYPPTLAWPCSEAKARTSLPWLTSWPSQCRPASSSAPMPARPSWPAAGLTDSTTSCASGCGTWRSRWAGVSGTRRTRCS
jgi:hypothetical protein